MSFNNKNSRQYQRLLTPRRLSFACALALFGSLGHAQQLCPNTDPIWPVIENTDLTQGEFEINADEVDLKQEDVVVVTGNVRLREQNQTLKADQVSYYRDSEQATADGNVSLVTRDLQVDAEQAQVDLATEQAELNQISYRLKEGGGRGEADVARTGNDQKASFDEVTFTTCPQGISDWLIKAKEMEINQETGRGTAKGVSIRFKDVPLLYLPWASFPVDDRRQSGFLYPSIGSSNDNGLDLSIPYYWNIAPNQDATITPRLITDRGAMLGLEYRYLNERSLTEFETEYLPNDDITRDHRAFTSLRHRGNYGGDWLVNLNVNHVSDQEFFEDFSDSLTSVSQSYLRSSADLLRVGQGWQAGLTFDVFETLDRNILPQNEPYERLPRLFYSGVHDLYDGQWLFEVDAEAVAFDRDEGVTGNRIDVFPRLSLPIYRPAYYFTPTIGVRHTQYDLDRNLNDSPSRTQGIASLEGGLFYERTTSSGRRQTLEPRIYYLYVPFEDQSDIPQFDTREITFGFGQLFRTNRFTGADRQADANQISLAVTTRLFSQDGSRQQLEASLGTIYYFRDQRVQLAGLPERTDNTSPLVGELIYRPTDFWRAALGFQWDPEDEEFDQALVSLQHRSESGRLINFAYRKRRDLVDQVDASIHWPINERWDLVSRWNYSLMDDANLEALLGFEYESCCWAFRMFGRRFVRNQIGDERNSIYFELELKGLGSLGRRTDRLLQRSIRGYRTVSDRIKY